VELLKEIVPQAKRIAVLWNSGNVSKVAEWKETQAAAQILGLTLRSIEARTPTELEGALASILRERPDARGSSICILGAIPRVMFGMTRIPRGGGDGSHRPGFKAVRCRAARSSPAL
jgi:hypothetical protein